MTTKNLSLI